MGITILEEAAVVALSLLISLALSQPWEKEVKLGADDTGRRHHGGRGGDGGAAGRRGRTDLKATS